MAGQHPCRRRSPSRSVEGEVQNYTTSTPGRKHASRDRPLSRSRHQLNLPFATLEDIADLYGIAAADPKLDGHGTPIVFKANKEAPVPRPVRASISIDTVRNEFYETQPPGSWAWIREIWSDFLIVDNDNGDLFKIPWTEEPPGDVTFGEPVRVQVEYVPAARDRRRQRDDARSHGPVPARHGRPWPTTKPPRRPHGDQRHVKLASGCPRTATDEEVTGEARRARRTKPEPDPKPAGQTCPKARSSWTNPPSRTSGSPHPRAPRRTSGSPTVTATAPRRCSPRREVRPARKEHFASLYERDPDGTREHIDKLAAGLIPVEHSEIGHGHNPESDMSDDAIFAGIVGMSFRRHRHEGGLRWPSTSPNSFPVTSSP